MTWKYNGEIIEESDIYNIVDSEYSEDDYEELLNECYETVKIGNLEYEPGRVLREVDPIAFRVGMSDETDSIAKDIIYCEEPTDNYGFGIEYVNDESEDA